MLFICNWLAESGLDSFFGFLSVSYEIDEGKETFSPASDHSTAASGTLKLALWALILDKSGLRPASHQPTIDFVQQE